MIGLKVNVKNIKGITKIDMRFKKAKEAVSEAAYEVCKDAQRQLRLEVTRKKLIDTHEMYNSIRAEKKSDKESVTMISQEGAWVDSMTPHFVPFNKGYAINRWAMRKGKPWIKAMAEKKSGYLKVFPHPFILNALSRTEAKIHGIVERRVRNAMAV